MSAGGVSSSGYPNRIDINPPPCGTELSGLLNCFASSGDFLGVGQCAQYSTSLANCMSTKVCIF